MRDFAAVFCDVDQALNGIVDFDRHKACRDRPSHSCPPLAVTPSDGKYADACCANTGSVRMPTMATHMPEFYYASTLNALCDI